MTNQGQGTVLENTVSIIQVLMGSQGHGVSANNIHEIIVNVGAALLDVKKDEEGTAPLSRVAPVARSETKKADTKAVEPATAPASPIAPITPVVSTSLSAPVAQNAPVKRGRGRPPKAASTPEAQTVAPTVAPVVQAEPVAQPVIAQAAPVLTATTEEPAAPRKRGRPKGSGKKQIAALAAAQPVMTETNEETGEVIVYNDPDPRSPRYKFKYLRDQFGVLPNGEAKRWNDLIVNDKIDQTIDGDNIISLFDGTTGKMLKRHLMNTYGMTPEEYKTYFNLPANYKVVNPHFSAAKSQTAKANGLGQSRTKQIATPQTEADQTSLPTPATVTKRTRTRASA